MAKTNIGFIGAGNMAGAIISGILASGMIKDVELAASDIDGEKLLPLQAKGVRTTTDSKAIAKESDYLFLTIKPQTFETVLPEIKNDIRRETVLVSIAAGIPAEYIVSCLGFDAKVVLVMPNTPLMLGMGASALSKNRFVSDNEFAFIKAVFDSCGETAVIPEDKMKEVIPINGSAPAFIYLFAKGFIGYAGKAGISEDTALKLFCATLKGSAEMMAKSGFGIDELIKMVSSPGGTTLAGLSVFEEKGLLDTIDAACGATVKRAYELSK